MYFSFSLDEARPPLIGRAGETLAHHSNRGLRGREKCLLQLHFSRDLSQPLPSLVRGSLGTEERPCSLFVAWAIPLDPLSDSSAARLGHTTPSETRREIVQKQKERTDRLELFDVMNFREPRHEGLR